MKAEVVPTVKHSNLAILMTPPASAAIAVIRIVGPRVPEFLQVHFPKPARVGRCVHGDLHDDGRVIDDAVVVLIDEKTADLNVHGGPWVVRSALDLAARDGFVVQDSATLPLPYEAVDAESLLEQEVLSYLPLARTELGVRALLAQPDAWAAFKSGPHPSPDMIDRILADQTLDRLLHPARVAIVGPANVGKSTLANQLFARERSITADVPGTTRDWVGEIANVDGLPVLLLDTPGLRETQDPIEHAAIGRSREEVRRADLIVLVIDASRPLEGEQAALLGEYPNAIRVINKVDRASGWDVASLHGLSTVATSGEGVDMLRRLIVRSLCGDEPITIDRPRYWTERQRAVLYRAFQDPTIITEL